MSNFHSEILGNRKFSQLLDRLPKNPAKHLPMLELMCLCPILGFEGRYRVTTHGVPDLDGVFDALYRQAHQLRGDVPRELSPYRQGLSNQRRGLVRIAP